MASIQKKLDRFFRQTINGSPAQQGVGIDPVTRDFFREGSLQQLLAAKADAPTRQLIPVISTDFLNAVGPWGELVGSALSSGTAALVAPTANHPGVIALSDSTTANGGYRIDTGASALLIGGGERAVFSFQLKAGANRSGSTVRMGFRNNVTGNAAVTDGAWINVTSNGTVMTLAGQTNNNTSASTTATSFAPVVDTWYSASIDVSANATAVVFTVFSETGAVVWQDLLTTTIPTGAGRETGFGVIASESSTDAAAEILWLDYVSLSVARNIVR